MSKILIFSDIHRDHNENKRYLNFSKSTDYDLAILPGDISNWSEDVYRTMNNIKLWIPNLFWVAGNHDYWDICPPFDKKKTIKECQELYSKNNGYLNRKIVEFGNHRILGCTLWYPLIGKHNFPDYKYVLDHSSIYHEALEDAKFLKENVKEGDIVVTHHLPCDQAISPMYVGDPWNKFFVHNIEEVIKNQKPLLWISGHSHERMVKMIHSTLYVRNPLGYPGENPNYSHLVVDTDLIGSYNAVRDINHGDSISRGANDGYRKPTI